MIKNQKMILKIQILIHNMKKNKKIKYKPKI